MKIKKSIKCNRCGGRAVTNDPIEKLVKSGRTFSVFYQCRRCGWWRDYIIRGEEVEK